MTEYDSRIQTLQTHLSSYNTLLSTLDEMAGRLSLIEADLRGYSEKMLMSVAARYGKDSLQYVQAGGKQRQYSSRRSSNTQFTSESPVTPFNGTTTNGATTNGKEASTILS